MSAERCSHQMRLRQLIAKRSHAVKAPCRLIMPDGLLANSAPIASWPDSGSKRIYMPSKPLRPGTRPFYRLEEPPAGMRSQPCCGEGVQIRPERRCVALERA